MLDKFYEIGGSADLITPVSTWLQNLYHGSSFHINIQRACGYSITQVEDALRQKGIYVWGGTVIDEVITLNVRRTQAEYALYWLERWQIPIDGHSKLDGTVRGAGTPVDGDRSSPKSTTDGVLGSIFNSVDAFTRRLGGL
jgi:hypothetical protein